MQTNGGAFRSDGSGLLQDGVVGSPPVGTSTWSMGATQLDQLSTPAVTGQQRTIYGWSISFTPILIKETPPIFGRLSQIIGGLVKGQQQTSATSTPYQRPSLTLPNDSSLLAVIWDPDQSPSPPVVTVADIAAGLAARPTFTFPYNLPQPMVLSAGEQVMIGIWLMPCLQTVGFLRALLNPSWSITYEDNRVPSRR